MRIGRIAFLVLGAVLAYPLTAFSKGQWCNRPEEGRRADLVLESASVDGVPVASVSAPDLHLKSEFYGSADELHAVVTDMDGGSRVVHVRREP